jgi:hypothetical protein
MRQSVSGTVDAVGMMRGVALSARASNYDSDSGQRKQALAGRVNLWSLLLYGLEEALARRAEMSVSLA